MKKKLRKLVVAVGVAVSLFTMAIPAQAATLNETAEVSNEVASEVVEAEKDYTVVTDKADLLTDVQIQNIEAKVGELSNYDAALYIESADRKVCTQKYTNTLSETMYKEVFGDYRNGVMIVFSFYEPENGYYAVHYGGNVNISESKVSSIIKGTYHDFKTDSTWIEGSFLQCVDYFKTVENEPVPVQKESEPWPTSTKILLTILAAVVLASLVLLNSYINLKEQKLYIERRYEEQRKYLKEIENENSNLKSENSELKEKSNELEIWKNNAQRARTGLEDDIEKMLAKEAAENFDKTYENVIGLEAIVENFDKFDSMMESYESLSDLAKSYITLDVSEVSKKRQKTGEMYAEIATKEIQDVCQNCPGTRYNRDRLDHTLRYYNGLPMFVRLMIAHTLIESLENTKNRADADYRRHQDSDSYSHNHNHSSYGSTFGGGFSHGGTFGGGFGGGH